MRVAASIACLLWASVVAGAETMRVELTRPERGQALFGEIVVEAEVTAPEPIQRVEFWINGEKIAVVEEPPFRSRVDVGEENVDRTISAIAYGDSGTEASTSQVFPRVEIDDEVNLRLQQLYVTVTRDEEPVLDLQRGDFSVLDNGLPQEIVTFEQGEIPMTLALLIDASSSMSGGGFTAALAAARGLLARLGPLDEALVMVFSDRVVGLSLFAQDGQTLDESFDQIGTGGGTAINDHLYAALRFLDGRLGKPVVILLSDGTDTVSTLSMEDVEWKVRRSNALIYRLQVTQKSAHGAAFNSVWRTIAGNRIESLGLHRAIETTGGRVRRVARVGELDRALDDVLLELRQQYAIGYYPSGPQPSNDWRPVRIDVADPDLVVRTRDGYVASDQRPAMIGSMFRGRHLSDDDKQHRIEKLYAQSRLRFPEVPEVTVEGLDRLREREDVVLVDVRAEKERAVSVIPGAVTAEEVLSDPSAFNGRTLVAYCTIGHRSGLFAKELQARGHQIFNLKGAILAWTHAGRDLELDGKPTRRVHVAGPKWSLEASGYEPVW